MQWHYSSYIIFIITSAYIEFNTNNDIIYHTYVSLSRLLTVNLRKVRIPSKLVKSRLSLLFMKQSKGSVTNSNMVFGFGDVVTAPHHRRLPCHLFWYKQAWSYRILLKGITFVSFQYSLKGLCKYYSHFNRIISSNTSGCYLHVLVSLLSITAIIVKTEIIEKNLFHRYRNNNN